MRDYGKISTTIWNSRKFARLTGDERLLYLYLHTCPHVNSVGCFTLKAGYATADLGWTEIAYLDAMDSLSKADLVGFDRVENLVRIVGFLRHDPFTNPKHAKGALKLVSSLPDCAEKETLINDLAACKYVDKTDISGLRRDSLSKDYRNPEPEPEPEPERAEAIASGGENAADPIKAVFDAGLSVLVGRGLAPDAARRFVGKLRKDHPGQDGQILSAIMDCGRAGAVDPIPWITAVLSKPKMPTVAEVMAKIAAEGRPQ